MKRSKLMRIIGILACLCLITSCFVGSTLAKYVTGASASDTARVAKFGVEATASGTLFGTQYVNAAGGNTPGSTNLTVQSLTTPTADNVVAPGTKNDTGLTFGVSGTPEVSVAVAFDITVTEDIFLKAITANAGYADLTTGSDANDAFTLASDYYPVVYTLKQGGSTVATGNLAAIKTYLDANVGSQTYAPGTNLATTIGSFTLTWAWDFDASGAGTYDKADTFLGDLAAGLTSAKKTSDSTAATITWADCTDGTDYNLDADVTIAITITQVD